MIRAHLFDRRAPADADFRWRGGDVSRIESLSDAAFALTLTLVVASAQAPQSFADLWAAFRGMPAFALAFTMIGYCWYLHHRYFRRYGLEDTWTIVLNLCLLFFVIFYAYPLRFMTVFMMGGARRLTADATTGLELWPFHGLADALMVLYGIGFVGVFGLFAVLHHRAYRLRETLALDALERHITCEALRCDLIMVCAGVTSIGLILTTGSEQASAVSYWLLGPAHWAHASWSSRRTRRLREELERVDEPPDPAPPA